MDEVGIGPCENNDEPALKKAKIEGEIPDSKNDGEVEAVSRIDREVEAVSRIDGEIGAVSRIDGEVEDVSRIDGEVEAVSRIDAKSVAAKVSETVGASDASKSSTPDATKSSLMQNNSNKSEDHKFVTETDAGITEYFGDHKGFTAVIKQRYSDFIVNEVDIDGNVVHLTDPSPPEEEEKEPEEENADEKKNLEDNSGLQEDDLAKLEALSKGDDNRSTVNIPAPDDKDTRTSIHLAIKQRFETLETKTVEMDGKKIIQAFLKKGKNRDFRRDEWPKSKKSCRFVKFVLYKENKDTMDAIGLIAKNLKVKESMFQYAGTKDKRAKTTQQLTAHRIHPKKLASLNKVLRNMGLGNFRYVSEPLKLGDLSGNQFVIVLRNVEGPKEEIEKAFSNLKTRGFINYFGMQRFGTTSVATHRIGCALLHGDWETAIDLILMPRGDHPEKDAFQKVWQSTKDAAATLEATPRFCGLERNLLEGLKKKMKPFNALERISRNSRLLYVHSYQALMWNQMVSKRLSVLGYKPVVGDLVLPKGAKVTGETEPAAVTAQNISQYTLQDVVLPLPGHSVVYPKNEVHEWYREALKKDGLDIDHMKRTQKDYSLPGAYRPIAVLPSDVQWSHHRYDDYTAPLTLSDWEEMRGETLDTSNKNKGKLKAAVLRVTLPSSCYATMALREVLRQDTSAAHQMTLNVT